jgi:hypothetical protein
MIANLLPKLLIILNEKNAAKEGVVAKKLNL